nr:MAG TPA: hypothetical protein [Caudoviricetes sp.]
MVSTLFPIAGIYKLRPVLDGVWFALEILTSRIRRFKSVTQHNDSLLFSWKFSFYNLQSLFPALDEMGFGTFYHFKEQR